MLMQRKDMADKGSSLDHSSDAWMGQQEVITRVVKLNGEAVLSQHPLSDPFVCPPLISVAGISDRWGRWSSMVFPSSSQLFSRLLLPFQPPHLLNKERGPVRVGQLYGIVAQSRDFGVRLSEIKFKFSYLLAV